MADYARALAVSPTHLSRVARATTGVSAQRLIEARLMREAGLRAELVAKRRELEALRAPAPAAP